MAYCNTNSKASLFKVSKSQHPTSEMDSLGSEATTNFSPIQEESSKEVLAFSRDRSEKKRKERDEVRKKEEITKVVSCISDSSFRIKI